MTGDAADNEELVLVKDGRMTGTALGDRPRN